MNIIIITSVPTSRPLWCSCQTPRRSRWCLRSSSAGIAPSWNGASCPEMIMRIIIISTIIVIINTMMMIIIIIFRKCLLTKILNCCHLLAKLILPSIRSGFPIWTKVRSWTEGVVSFRCHRYWCRWYVGNIGELMILEILTEWIYSLLGAQGRCRECKVGLPPQVLTCWSELWQLWWLEIKCKYWIIVPSLLK